MTHMPPETPGTPPGSGRTPQAGPPKWLVYGLAGKLLLVTLLTLGILWWKGFIF